MNRLFLFLAIFAWVTMFGVVNSLQAATQHVWYLTSPDHGQTYAYGSETNRVWTERGPDHHLALYSTFSNEPFAQGGNRRYDYFTFNFPHVTLGSDGVTFFYHSTNKISLVVAARQHGFLGVTEINLLPTSYLVVKKVHGYLTLTLVVSDRPFEPNPDIDISIEH